MLAALFTYINSTALFPCQWHEAIVMSLCKNTWNIFNPRSISLLNTINKLYAKYMYLWLSDLIQSENILVEKQTEFRKDPWILTTAQSCIIYLKNTFHPYYSLSGFYISFWFDSKADAMGKRWEFSMDKILLLTHSLYSNTSLKVRWFPWRHISGTSKESEANGAF